jgi:hypothetical protein
MTEPTTVDSANGYVGPTLEFGPSITSVPEPTPFALLVVAVVAFRAVRRR